MPDVNIFRALGDISHIVSIAILIWAIHINRSAEGVSLITQMLYTTVFCTRYLDLFWTHLYDWLAVWNFVAKIVYITSSLYIILLMTRVFARTREREKAWKFGAACLTGSAVLAPFTMMIFDSKWSFVNTLWNFSIILESVCVLPQLLLLRQTTVPTVIDSFYLLTLGSYRAFYILNWILRYAGHDQNPETQAVIFGVVQTAFYVDFAWVYWTRQRVKLRNGGVVDSEDLSRGWLVGKLLGRGTAEELDEEERLAPDDVDTPVPRPVGSKGGWGARGISVSADEGIPEAQRSSQTRLDPRDANSTRASETEGILGDSDDESDDGVPPSNKDTTGTSNGVGSGNEWRNTSSK